MTKKTRRCIAGAFLRYVITAGYTRTEVSDRVIAYNTIHRCPYREFRRGFEGIVKCGQQASKVRVLIVRSRTLFQFFFISKGIANVRVVQFQHYKKKNVFTFLKKKKTSRTILVQILLEKALQKKLFSDNPLNINTKNDKLFALKSTEVNREILYIL